MPGINPTGPHILVKPDKVEKKTKGGIYMPDQTIDQEQRAATIGTLIAVGDGAWKEFDDGEPWAKVGDRVSYAKYAGVEMTGDDGETYILINDNDVLAVLDG